MKTSYPGASGLGLVLPLSLNPFRLFLGLTPHDPGLPSFLNLVCLRVRLFRLFRFRGRKGHHQSLAPLVVVARQHPSPALDEEIAKGVVVLFVEEPFLEGCADLLQSFDRRARHGPLALALALASSLMPRSLRRHHPRPAFHVCCLETAASKRLPPRLFYPEKLSPSQDPDFFIHVGTWEGSRRSRSAGRCGALGSTGTTDRRSRDAG